MSVSPSAPRAEVTITTKRSAPGTDLRETMQALTPQVRSEIAKGYEKAFAGKPADWHTRTEATDVGLIEGQPSLFECRLWGASAALISKPHATAGGVPLWKLDNMASSGQFPMLKSAMDNVVGRVYLHAKKLQIPMQVMSLLCSDFAEQRSAAWYEQRRNYLTASEVSAVLGTCKYRTSEQLMKQKVERIQIPDNPAMAHGRHYEDEALDLFVQVR